LAAGDHRVVAASAAHLREDGRLWTLRPRGRRLPLGGDRQGPGPARGGGVEVALVFAGSDRPGDRAGAHGVSADLLHRPPQDRSQAAGLGRSGRVLFRGDPARHRAGGAGLFPQGPLGDRRGRAAGLRSGRPLEDERSRLGIYIAAATVPIVVLGLLFQEEIRTGLRSLYVISASLILVGVAMAWADRRLTLFGPTKREVGFADAMFVGMAQALALIPGVSRSGSTIAAALFRGLDRAEAARFSFLLSVPAVTAAGVKEGYELLSAGLGDEGLAPLFAGTLASFVVGYAAIAGLIAFLKRRSVMVFVGYRIALGLFLLVLLGAGVLEHLG